ncbi:HAMP domain-containing histidine kinase [Clostridium sp. 19966]|uniref:sensor histidine kinase n=1 Tax=Clostridium sp. 19966 TaxID=2768166 RepID=UPI0028DE2346|nr:HAMP domain-containing sensor histidine kinase [Clostridium sp. 19966]MDT8717232.1 HAMP domain-containing histidine kinase [Clostridium sp. 19966]
MKIIKKQLINTKSLSFQLLLSFIVMLIVSIIIMGTSQYLLMKKNLYVGKEQLLESKFQGIHLENLDRADSNDLDTSAIAEYIVKSCSDKNTKATFIDQDGNVVSKDVIKAEDEDGDSTPYLNKDEYLKILKSDKIVPMQIIKNMSGEQQVVMWRKLVSGNKVYGLIQLSTSGANIQDFLNKHLMIYLFSSFFVIIIAAILSKRLLNYTLKPLYDMKNTVEKIEPSQLQVRLPEDNGQQEIDSLSSAFNSMLERIEISFKQEQYMKEKMRHFISDASHELRTPLTSIHGFVEVLLRGAAKNEKQLDMALKSILAESDRLTQLVNDLLMLTRFDSKVKAEFKEEDLANVIDEIVPQLKIIAENKELNVKLEKHIYANVNSNQIKQIIYNLVNNAVQHTSENGKVSLALNQIDKVEGSFAHIAVSDNGMGISAEDREKIFDRFFRSDSHRSRKQGGYGLGLSIVKEIVDAHGGEIYVNSELGKGSTFSVLLPLSR